MLYPKMGIADLLDVSLKIFFQGYVCLSPSNDVHSWGPNEVICRSWMPCYSPMRIAIPRMTLVQRPFNTQRRKEQLKWWHDSCTWDLTPTRDGVMGPPPSPPKDFHKILNMSFLCAHGASMFHVGIFWSRKGFTRDETRMSQGFHARVSEGMIT